MPRIMLPLVALAFACGSACIGVVGNAAGAADGTADRTATAAPPGTGGSGPRELSWPVHYDGQPSALRRLSRDELVASLAMLTGSAPARDDFPQEQRPARGALLLSGSSFLATDLGRVKLAITDFAARIAPAMLTRSGCALGQQAQPDCLISWSMKFAEQALRRPAGATELSLFQKIFATAGANPADDAAAVQSMLTALFLAPSFLYRTEVGAPAGGQAGMRTLNDGEIAVRLSYLATLAPPDAELLDAANARRLREPAERGRQFARLAASDRGKKALAVFVLEWLGANEPHVGDKSPKYLTGLGSDFEPAIRASAEATIGKVVGESSDPTIGGLLSTDVYLTEAAIQKVRQPAGTGITASGDTAETARAGLLMHPHVLAAHTKEDGSSPFQIGKFLREELLCEPIPPPPANAASMTRDDVPPGSTLRQKLEYQTSVGVCSACHVQFAAMGYAFLPFDPVGRWVKQDATGKPWDLSGSITPAVGDPLTFTSPGELVRSLANRPQVHDCFAQGALEWAFGRQLIPEDQELVAVLDDVARRTRGGVSAIFQAIVSAPGFVNTTASR